MSTVQQRHGLTLAALGVAALSGCCLGLGFGLLADVDNREKRRDAEGIARCALGGAAATVGLYAVCPAAVRQLWTAFR